MIICNNNSKAVDIANELNIPYISDSKALNLGMVSISDYYPIIRFDNFSGFKVLEPNFTVYNNGKNILRIANKKSLFLSGQEKYAPILVSPSTFDYNSTIDFNVIGKSADGKKTRIFESLDKYFTHFKKNANSGWFYYHKPLRSSEYRVHCAHGKVIAVYEKPQNSNNEKNFTLVENLEQSMQTPLLVALKCLRNNGINFGYVDVLTYKVKGYISYIVTNIDAIPNLSIPKLREFYTSYFKWLYIRGYRSEFNFDRITPDTNLFWNLKELEDLDSQLSPARSPKPSKSSDQLTFKRRAPQPISRKLELTADEIQKHYEQVALGARRSATLKTTKPAPTNFFGPGNDDPNQIYHMAYEEYKQKYMSKGDDKPGKPDQSEGRVEKSENKPVTSKGLYEQMTESARFVTIDLSENTINPATGSTQVVLDSDKKVEKQKDDINIDAPWFEYDEEGDQDF